MNYFFFKLKSTLDVFLIFAVVYLQFKKTETWNCKITTAKIRKTSRVDFNLKKK
jgi:hypothetical protein